MRTISTLLLLCSLALSCEKQPWQEPDVTLKPGETTISFNNGYRFIFSSAKNDLLPSSKFITTDNIYFLLEVKNINNESIKLLPKKCKFHDFLTISSKTDQHFAPKLLCVYEKESQIEFSNPAVNLPYTILICTDPSMLPQNIYCDGYEKISLPVGEYAASGEIVFTFIDETTSTNKEIQTDPIKFDLTFTISID